MSPSQYEPIFMFFIENEPTRPLPRRAKPEFLKDLKEDETGYVAHRSREDVKVSLEARVAALFLYVITATKSITMKNSIDWSFI